MPIEHNPDYIHHQHGTAGATIREIVFGAEDGMVSTLGSITGIAAATGDPFTVILAGSVIISVESVSMAVGSFLSSKSEREIDERKLAEERHEIEQFPEDERKELEVMYIDDGWPAELAGQMAQAASENKDLMLKEMAYRELQIIPDNLENPLKNGLLMFVSYIIGGLVPISAYFFLPVREAVLVSVGITLVGLFILGAGTTKFSKRSFWKTGFEMVALASVAALIGYGVGQLVDSIWM